MTETRMEVAAHPERCVILIAVGLSPMIVPHHFTLWQAAASERTQAFRWVGTLVLLPVILMCTGWSYWVFRSTVHSDIGFH